MKVRVRLFAAAKEIVGRGELWVELPEGSTAAGLFKHLEEQFPRLKGFQGTLLLSINQEYADRKRSLEEGDEIALIPPVSGGVDV